MEMPRLEIDQQMARIGVDTVRARLNVRNHTRSMTMEREPQEMSVRHEKGKVSPDSDEVRANMGLKSSGELTRDAAAKAYAAAEQGISETVATTAYVSDVKIKGVKIGAAARNKMLQPIEPDPGYSTIPPKVALNGDPGSFDIDWTQGTVSIGWEGDGRPELFVDPRCSVEVQLTQRPSVRISLVEGSIPALSGRNISTRA